MGFGGHLPRHGDVLIFSERGPWTSRPLPRDWLFILGRFATAPVPAEGPPEAENGRRASRRGSCSRRGDLNRNALQAPQQAELLVGQVLVRGPLRPRLGAADGFGAQNGQCQNQQVLKPTVRLSDHVADATHGRRPFGGRGGLQVAGRATPHSFAVRRRLTRHWGAGPAGRSGGKDCPGAPVHGQKNLSQDDDVQSGR